MSYTVGLEDGSKVVVLYAKNFTWKDKNQSALLDGQPMTGRIYRAFKTPESNVWYLKLSVNPDGKRLPIMDGVRITNLKYSTPEWECEFIEVNDLNIMDLDILPEDYELIGEWANTGHSDFIKLINGELGFDVTVSQSDQMEDVKYSEDSDAAFVKDQLMGILEKSLTPFTDRLNSNIKWFSMRDPFYIQALTYLTNKLVDDGVKEDESEIMPFAREVSLDSTYGKGANIYGMAYHLDKYVSKKGNQNDLAALAKALIHEIIRLEIAKTNK